MDTRDISIISQTSFKAAVHVQVAEMAQGATFDPNRLIAIHEGLYAHLLAWVKSEVENNSVAVVQQGFPGAQLMPPVPGQEPFTTPHEQQQMQPPMQQPPVPGQQPMFPQQQQQTYAPPQPGVPGYQAPMVPAQVPQGPPPGAYPQQQMQQGVGNCPKCGGGMYDNRNDNARKRMGGYKLMADFKCKNTQTCKNVVWPPDFQTYANCPMEPR